MVCRYTARTPDEQITAASAAHTFGRRVGTDYITEYKFQLDGSVRVGFDFAGYMETRWFAQGVTPWERSLGEVVHQNLIAPLHSHFGCFKVDLDAASGKGESFEVSEINAGLRPEVPDLRGHATKYVSRSFVEAEGIGVSTFSAGGKIPHAFAVVDDSPLPTDDATPTGRPGYLIMPGPTVAQTLPNDHPFVLASAFSKYTLAVTKRKESEYRPTSVYDLFGPAEPYASLDRFFDGESLRQTDLVAWVNLGKEHVPRTEDVPLISNFGTYFDLCARPRLTCPHTRASLFRRPAGAAPSLRQRLDRVVRRLPRNIHPVNAAMDVYVAEVGESER